MVNVQGGLPADPYNPERPPLNIAINNPPCVPSFQAPGFMNDLLPVISAAVAIDFQTNAQNSPPRTFAYNLVSRNGYQNEIFAGLVMGVVDWVLLGLATNKFQNPEQGAQALIPKMCEMFVANQVLQYAELQQGVPPQMQAHITNLASMATAVQNEIIAFKQSQEYAAMMGQGGGGFGGGGWNQGGQQGGGSQWGGARQWGNSGGGQQWGTQQPSRWGGGAAQGGGSWQQQRPPARQFAGSLNQGTSSGLFAGGVQHGDVAQNENGSFNTSRFDPKPGDNRGPNVKTSWVPPTERDEPTKQASQAAAQVETKAPGPQVEHVDSTKLVWRPSVRQPYSLAYNPRTHLSYLQKEPDGTVIQLVKERTESSMDREKHRLPTAFGPAPKHIDTNKSVESLKRVSAGIKVLTEVVGDGEAGEEPPKKPLVQVVEEAWVLEPTENLAWLQGRLKCLAVMKDETAPDVYRIRAQVAEPFVSLKDETGALESFAEAKSYTELQEMMVSVEQAMSGPLYAAVNRKLTDMVNRVLSQSLSIGDIKIGSFVADVVDLPSVIEKWYGEAFSNAFLGTQVKNIRAVFARFATEESEHALTDNLLNDRDYSTEQPPKLTYLVSNFTLTYLNVSAIELELELDPKDRIASMITSDMPELYQLAESIFAAVSGTEDNFLRHLVRTSDDHVLEITQGLIGSDVYMVRKVL
jgi:hypothetical protein